MYLLCWVTNATEVAKNSMQWGNRFSNFCRVVSPNPLSLAGESANPFHRRYFFNVSYSVLKTLNTIVSNFQLIILALKWWRGKSLFEKKEKKKERKIFNTLKVLPLEPCSREFHKKYQPFYRGIFGACTFRSLLFERVHRNLIARYPILNPWSREFFSFTLSLNIDIFM